MLLRYDQLHENSSVFPVNRVRYFFPGFRLRGVKIPGMFRKPMAFLLTQALSEKGRGLRSRVGYNR